MRTFLICWFCVAVSCLQGATVVYVSERGEKKIACYSIDEGTGQLTRQSEVGLSGAPGALALSGDQKFLYAVVKNPAEFVTYAIDSKTGDLKEIGKAPAAGGGRVCSQGLQAEVQGEEAASGEREQGE